MFKNASLILSYIYTLFIAASAVLVLIVLLSCDRSSDKLRLIVMDPRCETVYHELEMEPETVFLIRYRHSVSGSLVKGSFLINNHKEIKPLTTEYSSFGPGLPLEQWENYSIEDGLITVYHNDEPRETIRLWVSPYTEETLIVDELEIPLYKPEISHLLLEIRAVP